MYVAAKGGEEAIRNAHALLAAARRGDPAVPELGLDQIMEQLALAVDRVMAEGSLYDRALAALAIKQARGDLVEAVFLARALRTTLPRFGASRPVDTASMRVERRVSATFKDLPGGQVLGPTFDYTHRLLDPRLATAAAQGGGPEGEARGAGGTHGTAGHRGDARSRQARHGTPTMAGRDDPPARDPAEPRPATGGPAPDGQEARSQNTRSQDTPGHEAGSPDTGSIAPPDHPPPVEPLGHASLPDGVPHATPLAAPFAAPLPRVADFLGAEGLLEAAPADNGAEPFDLTREALAFPADRATRLQALARGDEGFLLGLAYSTQRGYGRTHPFVGEVRYGAVEVSLFVEELGFEVPLGEVHLTECESVNQFLGSPTAPPQFTRGYGLAFGQSERKALSMALMDRALRWAELGEEPSAPAQDAEFVLSHCDNVQATGFVEHLKLPHYVDFQAELELLRRLRAEQGSAPAAEDSAPPEGPHREAAP